MTMRVFATLHTDDKFVYLAHPDGTIIAKAECSTSHVLDLLTVWRKGADKGPIRFAELPDDARELYTFHQEPGTDYYELWNAYGRRVAHHTIERTNNVITKTRYISMGRRLILDSLV